MSIYFQSGTGVLVGVKTDSVASFVVAEDGLVRVPTASPTLTIGSRVKIETGKVHPKHSEKAAELCLAKWVLGAKPSNISTGKIISCTKK